MSDLYPVDIIEDVAADLSDSEIWILAIVNESKDGIELSFPSDGGMILFGHELGVGGTIYFLPSEKYDETYDAIKRLVEIGILTKDRKIIQLLPFGAALVEHLGL